MKEYEARKKWCPMVQLPRNAIDGIAHSYPSCIGSDCMMFRWIDKRDEYGEQLKSTEGYCGLAGKP